MDEQEIDLLNKIYSEFSNFRVEMLDFKTEMLDFRSVMLNFKIDITDKVDQNSVEIANLSCNVERNTADIQSMGSHMIRLENTLFEKTSALFDGYKQLNSKLDRFETKLDSIGNTIEKQAVEIRVIQGRK